MHTTRSFRLVTLGAAVLLGGATVVAAQPPAAGRGQSGEIARGQRGGRAARGERLAAGRDQLRGALFQGIDLTTAQRRQLRDIGVRYGDQRQDLAKSLRANAGVKAGERPDSATRARLRSDLQTQHRALMDRELAELRTVLSAEQRTTFDRNVTTFRERASTRAEQARNGQGRGDRALKGRALRDGRRGI